MSILFDMNEQCLIDTRCPSDKLLNEGKISVSYTLMSDDITKGTKPSARPYTDRHDYFEKKGSVLFAPSTKSTLSAYPYLEGTVIEISSPLSELSQYGICLPFNFMGKLEGGGWKNQLLLNSPYTSPDKSIIYTYLTKPNGCNMVVALLSSGQGWKMDYSPYGWGHYFLSLNLLSSYDRAYKTPKRENRIKIGIFPVTDMDSCLKVLSLAYNAPFLDYSLNGGALGEKITLFPYGEPDSLVEISNEEERIIDFSAEYTIKHQGTTTLIPVKNGKRGAPATVYGYSSLSELYKKSMDTVDLQLIEEKTDGNLCEHQCWASAMLRFLSNHKNLLKDTERKAYESKLLSFLDILTEENEERAVARRTIFHKEHNGLPAFNVYKSKRVQELFFGITILLDAYKYFKDEKYYKYMIGATSCLLEHYQKEDGRIEVDWGGGAKEDYSTVCCPMIPILDVSAFLKDKDPSFSEKCFLAGKRLAEHLYKRGLSFPTEGGRSKEAEEEMEDGSISCTALSLLYFAKNGEYKEKYVKKAKEILDIHESWIIKTPICQMHRSTLRWWETQWEGDADGPAICAGHAWSIWRGEADYLYYELTKDKSYLLKSKNTFITNLSKIDEAGHSYAIYSPDDINGGGFFSDCSQISFKPSIGFPETKDSGLSRYVFIRLNECKEI